MAHREHRAEQLGEHVTEKGWSLLHVETCADNTAYALLEEDDGRRSSQRILFGGKVAADFGVDLARFSLSPDGRMLATAVRLLDRGDRSYAIRINDTVVYVTSLLTIAHLDWLDNDRLAWEGWNDDKHGRIDKDGIRTFVNGADVTGSLRYQPVLMPRGRHAAIIHENGKRYTVLDDGTRSASVDVPMNVSILSWREEGWPEKRRNRERPETVQDEKTGRVRMRYRGTEGPWFDEIASDGFGSGVAFDSERAKMAHVGCEHAGPAKLMGRIVGAVLGREDTSAAPARPSLLMWPIAVLFNPYFGPGYLYAESSKRYRPVDGAKAWKRGYRRVCDLFYSGSGALCAVVAAGKSVRLVMDEDEGPAYDEIYNARGGLDGVHYLARKGNRFFRVTVDGA